MIYGIKEMSLIDYKEPSFVIFLGGCNFRCPYCHNAIIVKKENDVNEIDELIEKLKVRKKLIKAVVISGGEPTLYENKLIELVKRIKDEGFAVKLDTNGTNPLLISKLFNLDLIDYIAMDIKNSFDKYEETVKVKVNINKIKESIHLIESRAKDYEFRTTINKSMHTIDDLKEIISYVKEPSKLYFQMYKEAPYQLEERVFEKYNKEEIQTIFAKDGIKIR